MNSQEAKTTYEQAQSYFKEGRYNEALGLLEALSAAFPNEKNILYSKAMTLAKLGRTSDALRLCDTLYAVFSDTRAIDLKTKLLGSAPAPGPPVATPKSVPAKQKRSAKKSFLTIACVGLFAVVLAVGAVIYMSQKPSTLHLRAYLQENDKLFVQGDEVWYEHESGDLPGKAGGKDFPTYVNGKEWKPLWRENISDRYRGLSPAMPTSSSIVAHIVSVTGRDTVFIEEQPDVSNGNRMCVRIRNWWGDGQLRANWYDITIEWEKGKWDGRPDERVLVFPEDHSMGQIEISNNDGGFSPHAEAKGKVTIPKSKVAKLKMSNDGIRDITWLERFAPDDFCEINFLDTPLADAQLAHLAPLTALRHLSLINTKIGDSAVQHIMRLKSLDQIEFGGTQITDAALDQISHLESLSNVCLERTRITDEGIKYLARLPRIWRIAAQNTSITGASLPELGGLEYFNELWIAGNKNLAFEKVSELGKLKALRILDVSYSTMNIAGLKNIAKLPQMNFLLLNNIPLHAADLQPLKECKMLRVLSLSDVKGLEFPVLFSILAEFPSLDEVDLGNVDLAGPMLEGVSKIIKLRRLYLANNLLTDESLAPLAQIGPSFNSIDIANNKITGPGLKNLLNLPGIRDLQISDNPLTDEAVTNLGQMKNLEWLWIHNTKISEAGFRDLQAALPKCHIEH